MLGGIDNLIDVNGFQIDDHKTNAVAKPFKGANQSNSFHEIAMYFDGEQIRSAR